MIGLETTTTKKKIKMINDKQKAKGKVEIVFDTLEIEGIERRRR